MPSIELVCIGQAKPHPFTCQPFALTSSPKPTSHRTPKPLFQRELSRLSGCTYHFGNPECAAPDYAGPYFAYELLSPESREGTRGRFLEIDTEYRPAFDEVLNLLLDRSPNHTLFFYSDWQFGPTRAARCGSLSLAAFHDLHDTRQLRLNACYIITP